MNIQSNIKIRKMEEMKTLYEKILFKYQIGYFPYSISKVLDFINKSGYVVENDEYFYECQDTKQKILSKICLFVKNDELLYDKRNILWNNENSVNGLLHSNNMTLPRIFAEQNIINLVENLDKKKLNTKIQHSSMNVIDKNFNLWTCFYTNVINLKYFGKVRKIELVEDNECYYFYFCEMSRSIFSPKKYNLHIHKIRIKKKII